MAKAPRRNALLANPFYLTLVVVSTLFVVTALGYLVSPYVLGPEQPGRRGIALGQWLDRNGPLALGFEFVVMMAAAVLAMLTDDWFTARGTRVRNPN